MRLTIENASATFVHLVNTITGTEFTQTKTCVIGDTRCQSLKRHEGTGTLVEYSFTLAIIETGRDASGEQLHDMRVIANRTVYLPW